ncbi:hypothetical protein BKA93DRAFT_881521 [Sparassis latifolia]
MYVHRPLLKALLTCPLFPRHLLSHVASTATGYQHLQLAGVLSTDGHARARHFKSNKRDKERQIDMSDISKNSGGWVGKTGKDWRHLKTVVGAGGGQDQLKTAGGWGGWWARPTEDGGWVVGAGGGQDQLKTMWLVDGQGNDDWCTLAGGWGGWWARPTEDNVAGGRTRQLLKAAGAGGGPRPAKAMTAKSTMSKRWPFRGPRDKYPPALATSAAGKPTLTEIDITISLRSSVRTYEEHHTMHQRFNAEEFGTFFSGDPNLLQICISADGNSLIDILLQRSTFVAQEICLWDGETVQNIGKRARHESFHHFKKRTTVITLTQLKGDESTEAHLAPSESEKHTEEGQPFDDCDDAVPVAAMTASLSFNLSMFLVHVNIVLSSNRTVSMRNFKSRSI